MISTAIQPISTIAELTDQWIQDVVRQYLKEDVHFVEIKKWQKESPEGFMSEIVYIDVTMKERELLPLVVKIAPLEEDMLAAVVDGRLAEAEIRFYKLLNSEKFRENLESLDISPPLPVVLYSEIASDVYTIVMRNLSWGDVKLNIVAQLADLQITRLAIDAIAVVHAIGYAYIEQQAITTNTEKQHELAEFKEIGNRSGEYIAHRTNRVKKCIDFALSITDNTNVQLKNSLRQFKANFDFISYTQKLRNQDRVIPGEMPDTVIHGDYWMGQVMFNTKQRKAVIIDWQFTQIGNPAVDIVSFLAASSDAPVYRIHLQEVLHAYTAKLNECLRKLSCSLQFSYDQVAASVSKAWPLGFFLVFTGLDHVYHSNFTTDKKIKDVLNFGYEKGIFK